MSAELGCNNVSTTPYTGPGDGDPLTEGELSLLLAVPRAAQNTPGATLFRLPLGSDPSMGWVDVTCAEAYSIISRLAVVWDEKLTKLMRKRTNEAVSSVGPGTTTCILVQPSFHAIFHLLAFWALGCTVQYLSIFIGDELVDANLKQSGCQFALYSGIDGDWVSERAARFDGEMIQLDEEEYAPKLAQVEKKGQAVPRPPWPTPRRPTPAIILQSSATTCAPKLLRFSLFFYTLGSGTNCQAYLSFAHPFSSRSNLKSPYTHPRLVFTPPYWQSFYDTFFVHLLTATPLAFAHIQDICELSSNQFISWAQGLEVGGTACCARFVREVAVRGTHTEFLQSLYAINISGALVDESTSAIFEKLKLRIVNVLGQSELNRLLVARQAPYSHLRPYPDMPPPLVHVISDPEPDGSRHVELWHTPSTSPHLANILARGGVPIKLEPFPGEGPHKGELAANLGDVFKEVRVQSAGGLVTAYIHIGRNDDHIRFTTGEIDDFNAATHEAKLFSTIESRLNSGPRERQWTLDALQIFGSNYPCTALVVQLRPPEQSQENPEPGEFILRKIYDSVDEANKGARLGPRVRVHTEKRVLVVSAGGHAWGPGADRLVGEEPRLMMTHKYTLQRWKNVRIFKSWLDGLDYSEL